MAAWGSKPKGVCVGCKFAEWDRTPSGRLDPSGNGKCGYLVGVVPKLPYHIEVRAIERQIEAEGKPYYDKVRPRISNDYPKNPDLFPGFDGLKGCATREAI